MSERVPPGKKVTIRDVARIAGVHPSTVSRILNGDDRRAIAPTRELIRRTADELGWRPNSLARSLSLGRTFALGFMIPSLQNPAYVAMMAGAEKAAEDNGNVVLLTDAETESRAVTQVERLNGRIDGLVMASASTNSTVFDLLDHLGMPFVLLNRRAGPGLPAVIGDDEAGVGLAIDHLVSLGHRQIAHIRGPRGIDTADRRYQAYRSSLRRHGLNAPAHMVTVAEQSVEGGVAGLDRLLADNRTHPTAIFCVNLLTAVGAASRATQLNLRIPDDISLVGFDDWPLADQLAVPMTTVRMPSFAMGEEAIRLLQRRIDGYAPHGDVVVPDRPQLIVRHSTSAPRQA